MIVFPTSVAIDTAPTSGFLTQEQLMGRIGTVPTDFASDLMVVGDAVSDALCGPFSATARCFRSWGLKATFPWYGESVQYQLPCGLPVTVNILDFLTDGTLVHSQLQASTHVEGRFSRVSLESDQTADILQISYTCGGDPFPAALIDLALDMAAKRVNTPSEDFTPGDAIEGDSRFTSLSLDSNWEPWNRWRHRWLTSRMTFRR